MSGPDEKPGEKQGAPQQPPPDDDRTRIGTPLPPVPPDNDATVPPGAAEPPGDDERTQFSSPPPPTPDSDATVFSAAPVGKPRIQQPPITPPNPAPADDKTKFAGSAPQTPPPGDGDQTRISSPAAKPAATPNPPSADDDATQFAGAQPPAPENDSDDSTRFAGAIPAPPPTSVPGKPERKAVVSIGTLINNNYEVKEVLKAGGMGEVYRGENVFTGDPVAIKVVLPELAADEKADLMFMREARTLSQLSDDAIVRYYNFVKDPDIDRYCLVMEFIKGVPLSDHTAQSGPISTDEAWILLKRLAKGLETAHGREVIHRDLSPDNVMLPDGIISEARLIDFGIAKSNVVKEGTMAGQFAGKFKYVSPEQLGHYGGIVGPASDIYGLALLLSAALLAKPLDMGSSIVEAVQARQSIPDLSDLPAEFRAILAYMLEPDPADRPENMAMIGHLVDVPSDIPHKYAAGLPLPAPRQTTQTGVRTLGGTTSTMAPRAAHEVSGLQAPPTAALEQARGKTSGVSADIPQNRPRGGGRAIGVLLAAFVTAITAVLYYAWDRGLIDQFIAGNSDPMGDVPETSPGLPPIQPNTRDGFLATLNTGACTFAARISEGPNLGLIEGFAGTSGAFADLPGAYEEKFGARPDTLERVVAPEQCAALSFAKALQGRGVTPISIQLAANEVTSGKSISGEITDPLGRNVWLVLVSGRGSVYNLTTRLSELVGDRRTFRFGLSLAEGAEATPQILLAVATTSPLATAANARDASPANELLPIILEEISKSDLKGAAGLAHILLVPG